VESSRGLTGVRLNCKGEMRAVGASLAALAALTGAEVQMNLVAAL
jgi:hypothetical protein